MHGPRCGLIGEQLVLFPALPPETTGRIS
jgi:hypothetical protein